jgi:uncharacterized protein YkwD
LHHTAHASPQTAAIQRVQISVEWLSHVRGVAETRKVCHSRRLLAAAVTAIAYASIGTGAAAADAHASHRLSRVLHCSPRTHGRSCDARTHGHSHRALDGHRHSRPAHARKLAALPRTKHQHGVANLVNARAATIASVLATPCQGTELTPEPGNLPAVRAAVVCLINRVRAEHDESPLLANADLEHAAEEHSQELVADDYFAHVSPNGTTPVDRVRNTGYIPAPSSGYVIGENLAWGTLNLATPQSIVSAWVASPGHLANILETQYQDTGIGVTAAVPPSLGDSQPGATYAQEFGVILG